MQLLRYLIAASAATVLSLGSLCVGATDDPAPAGSPDSFSQSVKAAGAEAERQSKVVGEAIKDGAEKVGDAAKEVAHGVADATVKGAKQVKRTAKRVASKTKAAVKGDPVPQDKKPAE